MATGEGVVDRARATITRRLCAVTGFYRYAVEELSRPAPNSG